MKKFHFRLQKVLDYRTLEESWAKDKYLAKRLERMESELRIEQILEQRVAMLGLPVGRLDEYRALQLQLEKSDDLERDERLVQALLLEEEAIELSKWQEKRKEQQALEKLREDAYARWLKEANLEEQKELDEWATQRKAA